MYLRELLVNPSMPVLAEKEERRGNLTMTFLSLPFSSACPLYDQVDHYYTDDHYQQEIISGNTVTEIQEVTPCSIASRQHQLSLIHSS